MLAWSRRNWITDVRKPEIMVLWRHCRRRAIYWLLRSPSQTCHTKPKTQINGVWRYSQLSCWWDAHSQVLSLKDFPKSQDAVALQQIKGSVCFTYDWSWWYPSGNRPPQQYLGFTAGQLVMVSSSIRLTAWLQNSKKRAERSERLMRRRVAQVIISALVICIIVCLSWPLIITVITPLPTKPSASKNARELVMNAAITDMQMRQRDVRCRRTWKYTKELADAKAENDALRDDVAAGRRRLHIKAVCQSVREATACLRRR